MSVIASPVYNSRNPQMLVPSSRVLWVLCALLPFTQVAYASDWRTPESQLAAKVAAVTGPGVIALQVSNRSSISPSDVESIHRGLAGSLAILGVRTAEPDQAAATVAVTLSENLQNYVWVAEIRQGANELSVVMISALRRESVLSAQNAPALTLRATPLISQPDPILDVAVVAGNPRRLFALSAAAITPYEFEENHWVPGQSLAIHHDHPLPRDLRGRIMLRRTADPLFDAYLPGLVCRSINSSSLAMSCSSSDDPWPLQTQGFGLSGFFAPARNFFTGALVPGVGQQKSAPGFYSAAAIPRAKYTLWIFAGVDGQLHLLDGVNNQTLPKIRWGSDISGLHTSCRPDSQVLATSAGSGSQDSVQAFEFPDREPVPVSQKLQLNGNITALWSAQDGQSATAVFRNSETGNYEAVLLDLACVQ
jgi:hypothetical protein